MTKHRAKIIAVATDVCWIATLDMLRERNVNSHLTVQSGDACAAFEFTDGLTYHDACWLNFDGSTTSDGASSIKSSILGP